MITPRGSINRQHVRKAILAMDFVSCKADPDVWFRPGTKDDGSEYY